MSNGDERTGFAPRRGREMDPAAAAPPAAKPSPQRPQIARIAAMRRTAQPAKEGAAALAVLRARVPEPPNHPRLDRLEALEAGLDALSSLLPEGEVYDRIQEQLDAAAREIAAPLTLAICGDAAPQASPLMAALLGWEAESSPAEVGEVRLALLQEAEAGAWMLCPAQGTGRPIAVRDLCRLAAESGPLAPLERAVAALVGAFTHDRTRDCILLYEADGQAARDGAGESAAGFVQRANLLLWIAGGDTEQEARPLDLMVVDGAASAQNRTDAASAPLLLRDMQARSADLFRESRLARMREAIEMGSTSPHLREFRIRCAVAGLRRGVESLTFRMAKLTTEAQHGLRAAQELKILLRGKKESAEAAIQRWRARAASDDAWLRMPEDEFLFGEPLAAEQSSQLAALRERSLTLARERRSGERELARIREERRFIERRLQEALLRRENFSTESFALQVLNDLLGENPEVIETEIAAAQALMDQCLAEEESVSSGVEEAFQQAKAVAGEIRQLASRIADHLKTWCAENGLRVELRRASLRRVRWLLQAHAALAAAAAPVARTAQALEDMVFDLGEETGNATRPPFEGCIRALRTCRHHCEQLLQLRPAAGNARALRVFRRLLAMETPTVAEAVRDIPTLLSALDMALTRVPAEELWRAVAAHSARHATPLARFAEGLAHWLCAGDEAAVEKVVRALSELRPAATEVERMREFSLRHAAGSGGDFMTAMLHAATGGKREILLLAPRSSRAYRQALLMTGAELLTAFE